MKLKLFLSFMFFSVALAATSKDKFKSERDSVQLLSSIDSYSPQTKSFFVALAFDMTPHWHIYWKNSGDSGTPPVFDWQGTAALNFSDIQWPRPDRISAPPLMSYGYFGRVLLPVEVKVPEGATGDLNLKLHANWLICKVECVPENKVFEIIIPHAEKENTSVEASEIQKFLSMKPETSSSISAKIRKTEKDYALTVTSSVDGIFADTKEVYFYPDEALRIKAAAAQKLTQKNNQELQLTLNRDDNDDDRKTSIDGVLELVKTDGHTQSIVLRATTDTSSSGNALWMSLFFAFIGGLILNLMPCVFPVLFLKLYAIANGKHQAPAQVRKEGWAYTAGVIVSFWGLALLLIILKNAGMAVGWGFQLQSPAFIAVAFLLFITLALSLAGFFEFSGAFTGAGQALTQKNGMAGSFFTGALATLVATPCSAPFMGAAVGYALTRQSWESFPIFTLLGFGLALPYLIIAYFPKLLSFIPKPGLWMERLKEFFGFTLMATALWLLWIFGRQQGSDSMIALLAAGLSLGIYLWSFRVKSKFAKMILFSFSILGIAFFVSKSLEANPTHAAASANEKWEAFTPEKLQAHLNKGEAVFIDFTASWCLTCQVNKKLVLHTSAADDLFERQHIVRMEADWTNYDPQITQTLSKFSRQSVPVYVFYPAKNNTSGNVEAKLLPELLNMKILESELQ